MYYTTYYILQPSKIRNVPIKVRKQPRVSIPDSSESDGESFYTQQKNERIDIVELLEDEPEDSFEQVVVLKCQVYKSNNITHVTEFIIQTTKSTGRKKTKTKPTDDKTLTTQVKQLILSLTIQKFTTYTNIEQIPLHIFVLYFFSKGI